MRINYTYQWLMCDVTGANCEPVEGATASTYPLHAGEVGTTLRIQVTASNGAGDTIATSAATEQIAPAGRPVNVVLPSAMLLSFAQPGAVAVAEPGLWEHLTAGELQTVSYQWERCDTALSGCEPIEDATSASTIITRADAGHRLRVAVIAENESGRTAAISEPTTTISASEGEEPSGEEPPAEPPTREQEEEEAPEGEVAGRSEEIVYSTSEDLYSTTLEGTSAEQISDCSKLSEEIGATVCGLAHPVISPDNLEIAVEVTVAGAHRIALMGGHGGGARLLPGEAESPAVTPNGRMITFTRPATPSNGQAGPELYTITLGETPEPEPVATGIAITEHAAYSPDGTGLAFLGKQHSSEAWHLYIAEANGEEPEELAAGGLSEIADPVFSGDSKYIYMAAVPAPPAFNPEKHTETAPGVRGIVKVPVEGGTPQAVPLHIRSDEAEVREPTPLPNDKLVTSVIKVDLVSFGDGFGVIRHPPKLTLFSTLTGENEALVAEPPDHKTPTGVTARLKGPHARTAFLQVCRLPHKVCGSWAQANTEKANQYAAYYGKTDNEGKERHNPNYKIEQENDCADYVSQLLHEAGMKMLGAYENVEEAWWARKPMKLRVSNTHTWTVAEELYHELRNTGLARPLEYGQRVSAGDMLFFDWYWHPQQVDHVGMLVTGSIQDPEHAMYTQHSRPRYWSLRHEELGPPADERGRLADRVPGGEHPLFLRLTGSSRPLDGRAVSHPAEFAEVPQ